MIRSLFCGGVTTKCRTVDKLDIFNDGSGVALYRLDGNANDESGNYHGTETNITYGGGQYERGAVFNGSSSKITTTYAGSFICMSYWFYTPTEITSVSSPQYHYSFATNSAFISTGSASGVSTDETLLFYYVGATQASYIKDTIPVGWNHVVVQYEVDQYVFYLNGTKRSNFRNHSGTSTVRTTMNTVFGNYSTLWFNGSLDQVRIFNRAMTSQEVATLYAECEPTSIVDNINPFEDGSLKALFKFEDTFTDSASEPCIDSTGVYSGTASYVTSGTGKFGNCAVFNGTTSLIDTTYTNNETITTISFWFKLSSLTNGQVLLCKSSPSSTYGAGWIVHIGDSKLKVESQNGASGTATHTNPTTLELGIFYHVSIELSSSSIKSSINSSEYFIESRLFLISTDGLILGKIGSRGLRYYTASSLNGSIDQLRIFDKALTPLEVASLYNETTPLEEAMSIQVDPFKDGSGISLHRLQGNAFDESGNYNGVPTNVTYASSDNDRGAVFNGSTYISNASLNILMNNTWAYSLWFKSTTFSNSVPMILATLAGYVDTYGALKIQIRDSVGYKTLNTGFSTVNKLTHLVVVGSLTEAIVYIDSINVGSIAITQPYVPYGSTKFLLGFTAGGADQLFTGSIKQVRTFNRALTQEEITKLYEQGA